MAVQAFFISPAGCPQIALEPRGQSKLPGTDLVLAVKAPRNMIQAWYCDADTSTIRNKVTRLCFDTCEDGNPRANEYVAGLVSQQWIRDTNSNSLVNRSGLKMEDVLKNVTNTTVRHYFFIELPGTGIVLASPDGVKVQLTNKRDSDELLWYTDDTNALVIRNKKYNLCLDVKSVVTTIPGGELTENSLVISAFASDNLSQLWTRNNSGSFVNKNGFSLADFLSNVSIPGYDWKKIWYISYTDGTKDTFQPQPYYFWLIIPGTDWVFGLAGGSTAEGTQIIASQKQVGVDGQLWYYDEKTFTLKNKANKLCFDIVDKVGTAKVMSYQAGSLSQQWIRDTFGCYVNKNSFSLYTLAKTVKGYDSTKPWFIIFYDSTVKDTIEPKPQHKTYYINIPGTALTLEVENGSLQAGTKVVPGTKSTTKQYQLWYTDTSTNTIRTVINDYCLSVLDGKLVVLPQQPGNRTQIWSFDILGRLINEANYCIVDFLTTITFKKTLSWIIQYVDGDDFVFPVPPKKIDGFRISIPTTNSVFEIEKGSTSPGAKVVIADVDLCHAYQMWYWGEPEPTGGAPIRNALNDYCLDISDAGVLVVNVYVKGKPSQLWARDIYGQLVSKTNRRLIEFTTIKLPANMKWIIDFIDPDKPDPISKIELPDPKSFRIVIPGTKLVLELEGGKTVDGTKVVPANKDLTRNYQLWYFDDQFGTIRNVVSNTCLDIREGVLIIRAYEPNCPSQLFNRDVFGRFINGDNKNIADFIPGITVKPGLIWVIDVFDDTPDPTPKDIDGFRIVIPGTKIVFELENGKKDEGTRVVTAPLDDRKDYQLWYQDKSNNTIVNVFNKLCLDIVDGKLVVNAFVPGKVSQIWFRDIYGRLCNRTNFTIIDFVPKEITVKPDQQWIFITWGGEEEKPIVIPAKEQKSFRIVIPDDKNNALTPQNGGKSPGTKVVPAPRDLTLRYQLWYIDEPTSTLRNLDSDLCLDVDGTNQLILATYKAGTMTQQWSRDVIGRFFNFAQQNIINLIPNITIRFDVPWTIFYESRIPDPVVKVDVRPFRIAIPSTDYVLELLNGDSKQMTPVVPAKKDEKKIHQLWYQDINGTIRNLLNGLYLDFEGGKLVVNPFQPTDPNQQWFRDPLLRLINRDGVKLSEQIKLPDGKVISQNILWFFQWIDPAQNEKEAVIKPPPPASFRIAIPGTTKVFELDGGKTAEGTVVVPANKDMSKSYQLWYFDASTRTIRNIVNQLCLTVQGDTLVVKTLQPDEPNQKWTRDVFGRYVTDAGKNIIEFVKVLGVKTTVRWVIDFLDDEQKDDIKPIDTTLNVFRFSIPTTKFVFAVETGKTDPGSKVIPATKDISKVEQLWFIHKETNTIRPVVNRDLVLDVVNETLVITTYVPNKPSQWWIRDIFGRPVNKDNSCIFDFFKNQFPLSPTQQWTFEYIDDTPDPLPAPEPQKARAFYIVVPGTNNVFEVQDGSKTSGAKVVTNKLDYTKPYQLWYLHVETQTIRNVYTDLCLDMQRPTTFLYPYEPSNINQRWICDKTGFIRNKSISSRVIEIWDSSKAEGAPVGARDENGGNNQKWNFEATTAPYFQIISKLSSNLALTVTDSSKTPGTVVSMSAKTNNDNQLFKSDPDTGIIRSKINDFPLDVRGGFLKVTTYAPDTPTQKWGRDPFGRLVNGLNISILDLVPELNIKSDIQWIIKLVSGEDDPVKKPARLDLLRIILPGINLALELENGNTKAGTNVVAKPKDLTKIHQLWYLDTTTGTIRSVVNDLCISISGDKLIVNPFSAGDLTQKWSMDVINRPVNQAGKNMLDFFISTGVKPYLPWIWDRIDGTKQQTDEVKIFRIVIPGTDQCFELQNGITKPLTPVVPGKIDESKTYQLWYESANRFYNLVNQLVLDVKDNKLVVNTIIQGDANQTWFRDIVNRPVNQAQRVIIEFIPKEIVVKPDSIWRFLFIDFTEEPEKPKPKAVKLFYMLIPGTESAFEIEGGSDKPGAKVIVADKDYSKDEQLWYIDLPTSTIRNQVGENVLDVDDSGKTLVMLPYKQGKLSQQWFRDILGRPNNRGGRSILEFIPSTIKVNIILPWFFEFFNNAPDEDPQKIDKAFRIVIPTTDFVLELKDGKTTPVTEVVPGKKDPTKIYQLWFLDKNNTIRNVLNGLYLDVEDEKLVVNVLQTGDPNQQWVRDIVNRFINRANKLLMDYIKGITIPKFEQWLVQYTDGTNEAPTKTPKSKFFRIVLPGGSKSIETEGGKSDAGTSVVASPKDNTKFNQFWYFIDSDKTVRSVTTDLCLDVVENKLVVNPFQPGAPNQRWSRDPLGRFVNEAQRNILEFFKTQGVKPSETWTTENFDESPDPVQRLTIAPEKLKAFRIILPEGKLALATEGDSNTALTRVVAVNRDITKWNQLWYFEPITQKVRNFVNDLCLDVEDEKLVVNVTQVGDPNQKWSRDPLKRLVNEANRTVIEFFKASGVKTNVPWTYEFIDETDDPMPTPERTQYFRVVVPGTDLVFEVQNADKKPGAKIITAPKNLVKNEQLFYREPQTGKPFLIKSAMSGLVLQVDVTKYKVTTFTGTIPSAETDSNVTIQLFGDSGNSVEVPLGDVPKVTGLFAKGKQDTFTITSPTVGELSRIVVSIDGSGRKPDWFLDKVTVEDTKAGKTYTFACNKWLSPDREDKQTSRDLSLTVPALPVDTNKTALVLQPVDSANDSQKWDRDLFSILCTLNGFSVPNLIATAKVQKNLPWTFEYIDDTDDIVTPPKVRGFRIIIPGTNRVIELENGNTASGTNVVSGVIHPLKYYQLWYLDDPTKTVRSAVNGLCIDSDGDTLKAVEYKAGSVTQQWKRDNLNRLVNGNNISVLSLLKKQDSTLVYNLNVPWRLKFFDDTVKLIKETMCYALCNQDDKTTVMSIQGGNAAPGAKLTMSKFDKRNDFQLWYDDKIDPRLDITILTARSKLNGLAVTVDGKTLLMKEFQPGNLAQQWFRDANGGLINKASNQNILEYFKDPPKPVITYFPLTLDSGLAVEIENGSKEANAKVVPATVDLTKAHQLWYLHSETNTRRSKLNDFCIGADGPLPTGVMRVNPYQEGNQYQQWTLKNDDLVDGKGTSFTAYFDKFEKDQQLQPQNVPGSPGFYYLIRPADNAAVAVKDGKKDSGSGVVMQILDKTKDWMIWKFDQSTGTIRSKMNDFCITIEGNDLKMRPYNKDDKTQAWYLDCFGRIISVQFRRLLLSYFTGLPLPAPARIRNIIIRLPDVDKAFAVEGSSKYAGAKVIVDDLDKTKDNQLFYEDPKSNAIRNRATDLCITADGKVLKMREFKAGDKNQEWHRDLTGNLLSWDNKCIMDWMMEFIIDPSKFFNINLESGKVLEVEGGNKAENTRVVTGVLDKTKNYQLWYLHEATNTYRSKINDFCITIDDDGKTLVVKRYKEGNDKQVWKTNKYGEVVDSKGKNLLAFFDALEEKEKEKKTTLVGLYYAIVRETENVAVSIDNGSKNEGATVGLATFDRTKEYQAWKDDKANATIISKLNGLCITVEGNLLKMRPFSPSNLNQRWYRDTSSRAYSCATGKSMWSYFGGGGTLTLPRLAKKAISVVREKPDKSCEIFVISLENGNTAEGTKLVLEKFTPPPKDQSIFYDDATSNANRCLKSITNDLCITAEGSVLRMRKFVKGNLNQEWTYNLNSEIVNGNGVNITTYFDSGPQVDPSKVINISFPNAKVLEIENGSTAEGAKITLGVLDSTKLYQKWYVHTETKTIRSMLNDFCLTIDGNAVKGVGGKLKVVPYAAGNVSQVWEKDKFDQWICSNNVLFDYFYTGGDRPDQKYTVDRVYYASVRPSDSMCISIDGGSSSVGASVGLSKFVNLYTDSQLWMDHSSGTIRSKLNLLCITAEGDTLRMRPYQAGNDNQVFYRNTQGTVMCRGTRRPLWSYFGGTYTPTVAKYVYQIVMSDGRKMALTTQGDSLAAGAKIILEQYVAPKKSNTFYDHQTSDAICSIETDLCVTLEGKYLYMRPYKKGDPNQQWFRNLEGTIVKNSNGTLLNDCFDK